MKLLFVVILLLSCSAVAEGDPCEKIDYPVTSVKHFNTSMVNLSPSVYRENKNSKVTVSVSKLKNIIETKMRSHRPYLKKAKEHLLSSLNDISPEESINETTLWINSNNMSDEEQQIASHVLNGIQQAFVIALFTESAFIEVNNQQIKKLKVRFLEGVDETITTHEYNKVKNIRFESNDILVFQNCWLSK